MLEGIYDLFESVNTPHYSNADGSQRIADRMEVHRFDYQPELEGVKVVRTERLRAVCSLASRAGQSLY